MSHLTPPPFATPVTDDNGLVTEAWKNFFLKLRDQVSTGSAPSDAGYVVVESNPDLTDEVNLGAMANGWLHSTVAAGLATLTTLGVLYSELEPTVDVTIPANMGAVVPDRFVIAPGKTLTIGAGAVFQVL